MVTLREISSKTSLDKQELDFWDLEVFISGEGMNRADGGNLNPLSFYTQSLVMTNDYPMTMDQARILFNNTTVAFDRTDMKKMGYIDLWGGVNRDISDKDTAHPHAKNLWLIRWDGTSVDRENFPEDGVTYLKNEMRPFEEALVEAGVPIRGFVNYADTEWSREQLVARLYGENYDRLRKIKAHVDPEELFSSNPQSITIGESTARLRVQQ